MVTKIRKKELKKHYLIEKRKKLSNRQTRHKVILPLIIELRHGPNDVNRHPSENINANVLFLFNGLVDLCINCLCSVFIIIYKNNCQK